MSTGEYEEWYALCEDAGFEDDEEPDYTVWRTQDRREIPIVEMGADHLRRTIQVLRGRSPKGTTWRGRAASRVRWVQAMVDELVRRGEPLPED